MGQINHSCPASIAGAILSFLMALRAAAGALKQSVRKVAEKVASPLNGLYTPSVPLLSGRQKRYRGGQKPPLKGRGLKREKQVTPIERRISGKNPMVRSGDLCGAHRVSVGMQASPQPHDDTRKLPCSPAIGGKCLTAKIATHKITEAIDNSTQQIFSS